MTRILTLTRELMDDTKNTLEIKRADWHRLGAVLSNGKWRPMPMKVADFWHDSDTAELVLLLEDE